MRVAGVVAEFNPFHNGHAALIEQARSRGVDCVVAVMSGNFVQRADFAVTEKRVRTACALRGGADLVVELPLAWATSSAPGFARGAVALLRDMGCVDTLLFGSECADPVLLRELADSLDHPDVERRIRELLAGGITYARARQAALTDLLGERAAAIANPNDLLAVEYLRQARQLGFSPETMPVRRLGVGHDAARAAGRYASASYIRARAGQLARLGRYMPAACAEQLAAAAADGLYPADPRRMELAVLAQLRRLGREEYARLPDLSEGLENRLRAAVQTAGSLEALYASLKTKRYTHARIRRLVLSAFLGVTREDAEGTPPYLRVLGFGPRGRELLPLVKERCPLPHGAGLLRLAENGRRCLRTAALEAAATDLYALALPAPPPCGHEYSASAVFLKG